MGNVEQTLCRSQSASVGGAVTMSRGANRASEGHCLPWLILYHKRLSSVQRIRVHK
jgi:hypothetical protein